MVLLLGVGWTAVLNAAEALLFSLPIMWLWNAVIPDVIGAKSLTWSQALWLSMLCGLLLRARGAMRADTD